MARTDFVHLRVHTAYSMSEGAIQVKDLVRRCAESAMPAVAITDTGNVFGALEFSTACADAGVQPIVGCQMAVRNTDEPRRRGVGPRDLRRPEPDSVVLLAQSESGLTRLQALISKAFLETPSGERPQVDFADLQASNEGLILLTGGVGGPVGRLLLEDRPEDAAAALARQAAAFDGRCYVEIQRHGMATEDQIESALIDLAYAQNIPLVATNEPFFPGRDMFEAHDVLICMAEKTFVDESDRRRLTPEHYFKTADEMRELFADLPEACDNTLTIARRCAVMAVRRKPILPHAHQASGRTEAEALRALADDGLAKRLHKHVFTDDMTEEARETTARPYRERLDYELGIIESMGFPGYFLIVADFIQWAKEHDIPVGPGRGSGAGSVVAWALTITDLDPIRFNLLFERFLNPERVSMPDFDIDFCQDRRGEVIHYVQGVYGDDKVAQIITFGKLQARAVLRSVGRVLQMPLGFVDKICKMVPNNPAKPCTLPEAIRGEPRLQELQRENEQVARMLDIGVKLEGLYSHASTHAAGVVIGDRPLSELVALYRDPNADMPVTQYNMKWVEQAGLVKFDFLGLKTLTVLDRAVKLLRPRNITVDLSALPLDDRDSYAMLGRGETAGVFQLESTGMRDVLRNMKPDSLEDIIAVVALYRPGPMDNIPSYIRRKQGLEPVHYMHEKLEPILRETYGIMIYQEQVMQAAQFLAGYTLGGADLLRRAMGKKIQAEMDKQRSMFCQGAEAEGISAANASEIFDQIAKFAGYGFNKSHAAAYALVAYQTAYMKANYPVEFMAATMTYDMHNTDKLGAFKTELQRLGIALLGPDINRSEVAFSVEDGAVRYALAAIKNVGEAAMAALVEERERGGPFKDLSDFARRLDTRAVNKRLLENLVKAGAFDSLDGNRARVFDAIDTILRHAQSAAEERTSNQVNLFGGADQTPALPLPKRSDWPPMERLAMERDAVGFYLSAHPLDSYATGLERLGVVPLAALARHVRRGETRGAIKVAVIAGAKKERTGKTGKRYAFVELSDASATLEAVVFSEVLNTARDMLESQQPLLVGVDARVEGEGDDVRLMVQSVDSLDVAVAKTVAQLKIYFGESGPLSRVKEILDTDPPGKKRVFLVPRSPERDVEIEVPRRHGLAPETLIALRSVPGILDVREV
ncbi:DNA polymerase III subunit alpha [Roseospira marina]|uniref:DNA polymerase III subunit alpha n=1 Tax=Roseospira marina TaxID=140057 RepID=A0A5M6IHY1_9PROT|nr:DNA polymerase III subunit alpha [Roseospira marina]KAA5607255.1 DNA polymerase III subunit alpha [Roseospira marina]MBB4312593.1 DNA polymerase-3 subunit alpha [Roseospira marina]MBB5085391.1 DNA polymerase-3 subunit alpha [Roseospira marina]